MELRLSVGGDPEGGWLVDIHDGERSAVYRPDPSNKTASQAAFAALKEHDGDADAGTVLVKQRDEAKAELADAKKTLADAQAQIERLSKPVDPPAPAPVAELPADAPHEA